MHYSIKNPYLSILRIITVIFWDVQIFRSFTVVILQSRHTQAFKHYRNDPKFWDRQVWARSSLIRVYTVCNSVCIFCTYNTKVEPHCLNFRISRAIFLGSEFLGVLQYFIWGECLYFSNWKQKSMQETLVSDKKMLTHYTHMDDRGLPIL